MSARRGRSALLRFAQSQPLGALGAAIMLLVVAAAVGAGAVATADPTRTDAASTFLPPSPRHWLGTDHLGRDVYSRIVYGARVSLAVGVTCSLLVGLG